MQKYHRAARAFKALLSHHITIWSLILPLGHSNLTPRGHLPRSDLQRCAWALCEKWPKARAFQIVASASFSVVVD